MPETGRAPDESKNRRETRYIEIVKLLTYLFGGLGLLLILLAYALYTRDGFTDVKNGRLCAPFESVPLLALLALPYIIQFYLLIRLFLIYKKDESLWELYGRYLVVMFAGSFCYSGLWFLYTGIYGDWYVLKDSSIKDELTYLALLAILVLLWQVGHFTRIITLRPARDGLTSTSARGGDEEPAPETTTPAGRKRIRIVPGRSSRSNRRKESDKTIRKGIERFPFGSLLFFFSVFLSIGYLFGFAFAFHDRQMISETASGNKTPALFMAREYETPASCPTPPSASTPTPSHAPTPSPVTVAPSPPARTMFPEFFFYYDQGSAGLRVKEKDGKDGIPGRRQSDNKTELEKLKQLIECHINNGDEVSVELVGRADDASVSGAKQTYSSNYELSSARAQNLKFELLQYLRGRTNALVKVEWFSLPVSNDPGLRRVMPLTAAEQRQKMIVSGDADGEQSLSPDQKADLIGRIDGFNAKLTDPTYNGKKKRDDIKNLVKRAGEVINKGKITYKSAEALLTELTDTLKACELSGNSPSDEPAPPEACGHAGDTLNDKCERLEKVINYFESSDKDANKRVVEAYVTVTAPPPPPPAKTTDSIPPSLMDYIYFAMYTITTTGYGDIKPTTTYAKFLCTLANVSEMFFIVVFFNTLISIRGGDPPPPDAKAAGGGPGGAGGESGGGRQEPEGGKGIESAERLD